MKIIIFGSTGTIGKHLVEQSLNKGHEVTAFSRNIEHLNKFNHPKLTKVVGDVFNVSDCQQAIQGQGIVIIVLGSGNNRKSIVRSSGTVNGAQNPPDYGEYRHL